MAVVVGVVVVVVVVGGIVGVVAMWCLCRALSVVVAVARWCLCRAMSEVPGGVTPHPYGSITHQDVRCAHYLSSNGLLSSYPMAAEKSISAVWCHVEVSFDL